jgi:hypothetical protein
VPQPDGGTAVKGAAGPQTGGPKRIRKEIDFATVRQPDGGTAVNGAAGHYPQNGSPKIFSSPDLNREKSTIPLPYRPAVLCSLMKERIQKTLAVLIGQPLWSSGRAADLEWFAFGARRTVKDSRGKEREVGEYALHVQCAWRIRCGSRIVAASRDLYSPPEETANRTEDFNWDVQGGNLRDRRIAELFQNETREFLVQQIEAGEAGNFTIILDQEYAVDVFPDDSQSREHWRFFRPYRGEGHFVVSGSGIEAEP